MGLAPHCARCGGRLCGAAPRHVLMVIAWGWGHNTCACSTVRVVRATRPGAAHEGGAVEVACVGAGTPGVGPGAAIVVGQWPSGVLWPGWVQRGGVARCTMHKPAGSCALHHASLATPRTHGAPHSPVPADRRTFRTDNAGRGRSARLGTRHNGVNTTHRSEGAARHNTNCGNTPTRRPCMPLRCGVAQRRAH